MVQFDVNPTKTNFSDDGFLDSKKMFQRPNETEEEEKPLKPKSNKKKLWRRNLLDL